MLTRCPDESVLMDLVDGLPAPAADGELSAHVDSCERCAHAVLAVRSALATVIALGPMGRRGCPSPEELAGARTGALALHVAICANCREELADLEALEEEPLLEIVARLAGTVVDLVSQTFGREAGGPCPVGALRGPDAAGLLRLVKPTGDGELRLELRGADRSRFSLAVELEPPPCVPVRIDLERDGVLLESHCPAGAGRTGSAGFIGLVVGRYRVVVAPAGQTRITVDVNVTRES